MMFGQSIGQAVGRLSTDNEALPSIKVDLTNLLSVIKNERRRHAIDLVAEAGGDGIELGDLAEGVAARELDKPVDEISSTERKRVYIALVQIHLETIEEAGLIKSCGREQEYFATIRTERASELIDLLRDATGGDVR